MPRSPLAFRRERSRTHVQAAAIPPARRRLDHPARLRRAAWIVLAAGVIGAAALYWSGLRRDASVEELLPASAREHRRQMGILYGTIGEMTVDMGRALRQPDVQALLTLAAGIAGAAICFRLAQSD
jgi:hypothetical protein